ncbi:MAG: hypothetical protein WD673_09210 [Alphaproteobacteria bacterium]
MARRAIHHNDGAGRRRAERPLFERIGRRGVLVAHVAANDNRATGFAPWQSLVALLRRLRGQPRH